MDVYRAPSSRYLGGHFLIRIRSKIRANILIAPFFLTSILGGAAQAEAATHKTDAHHHRVAAHVAHHSARYVRSGAEHHQRVAARHSSYAAHRVAWRHWQPGLQCVPYARRVSGIELSGNAYRWWNEADGRYARGQVPEAGAILSFRRSGRMRLGHVAVVTETVNPREVLITQANWPGGGAISKAVPVIDVSPANDWTQVRVGIGHSETYGSVYRTNGFIYGQQTPQTLMADANAATEAKPAGLPAGGAVGWSQSVQLAAAPSYGDQAIASSAPDRDIR
jgi:surface antigen